MTLCIAAKCVHRGVPHLVLATDWKVETPSASSETLDKLREVHPGWPVLLAGDNMHNTMELAGRFGRQLKKRPLEPGRVLAGLRAPVHAQRYSLANEFIFQNVGKSYAWFLKNGKASLPDELFTRLSYDVAGLKLDSELIVCGFIPAEGTQYPVLCVVSEVFAPVVQIEDHFGTIGSGAYIASAALHQRSYDNTSTLKHALYCVFEAMSLGQSAPGVGETMTINILPPTGKLRSLKVKAYSYLEKLFEEFGPRPINASEKRWKEWGDAMSEGDDILTDDAYTFYNNEMSSATSHT